MIGQDFAPVFALLPVVKTGVFRVFRATPVVI
jgi:hypothetical protein